MFETKSALSRVLLLSLIVSLSLFGGCSRVPKVEFTPSFWEDLEKEYGDEYGAVYLVNEHEVGVKHSPGRYYVEKTVHWRIAVLDPVKAASYDNVAQVVIPYTAESKIKFLDAWIYLPSGEIRKIRPYEIHDRQLTPPEYILFAEVRGKAFAFPTLEKHCVLDVRYVARGGEDRFVFQDDEIPVKIARFTLGLPRWEGIVFAGHLTCKPEESDRGFTWTLKNLPPAKGEPYMPPFVDVAPQIRLGAYWLWDDWNEVGAFYRALSEEALVPDEAIKKKVEELTAKCATEQEKARAIFHYVQSHVRWVEVELDRSGWKPHPASKTFDVGYGDCKDMATLLVAMLDVAGIKAQPAIISTKDNGRVQVNYLSRSWFNHCITHVSLSGDTELWLDPTVGCCPFGELPSSDEGRMALLIDEDTTVVKRTPASSCEDNVARAKVHVELTPEGQFKVGMEETYLGEQAIRMRIAATHMDKEEKERFVSLMLDEWSPGVELGKYEFQNTDDPDKPLILRLEFSFPASAVETGDMLVLPFAPPHHYNSVPRLLAKKRKYPVEFREPWTDEAVTTFELPPGRRLAAPLEGKNLRTAYGSYRVSFENQGSRIVCRRRFSLKECRIPRLDYDGLQSFLKKVRRLDGRSVMLDKTST